MESDISIEFLKILEKAKEIIKSSGKLILEIPPEINLKLSVISTLYDVIKDSYLKKLIICTSQLENIDRLLPHISKVILKATDGPGAPEIESESKTVLNEVIGIKQTYDINTLKDAGVYTKTVLISPYLVPQTRAFEHFTETSSDTQALLLGSKVILCTQDFIFRKGLETFKTCTSDSILIFEEGINLDTCFIDYCSVNIDLQLLASALRGLKELSDQINSVLYNEVNYSESLSSFYEACKKGTLKEFINYETQYNNLAFPDRLLSSAVPGNIRKPQHFVKYIKSVIVYFRQYLRTKEPNIQSCYGFLHKLNTATLINIESLQYYSILINCLYNALPFKLNEDLISLACICDFCSLVSLYPEYYSIVFEPYPDTSNYINPVLQLSCNSSLKFFNDIVTRFSSTVILTSSCTPSEIYKKLLGLDLEVLTYTRTDKICPLILTKGSDQLYVSTKSEEKIDDGVMRNYGELLLEISDVVPDGVVAFFPEWTVLQNYIIKWNESGLIYRLLDNKIVLIEIPEKEFLVLDNFKKACESGRGAVLLAVSRGKISEYLHLYGNHIKSIIILGVPQPNILSRALKARLCYLKERLGIEESEYLNFDAIRQSIACLSHSIKANTSYSIMILADKRFESQPKRSKIPEWMQNSIKKSTNVSTDTAKIISLKFLKSQKSNN